MASGGLGSFRSSSALLCELEQATPPSLNSDTLMYKGARMNSEPPPWCARGKHR